MLKYQVNRIRIAYYRSGGHTIRLWIIDDGVCDQTLTGHKTGRHMSILQLKDGRICSSGLDGNINIWSDH